MLCSYELCTAKTTSLLCWVFSDCRITLLVPPSVSTAACETHAFIFRKYISGKSAGKGKALLECMGLSPDEIKFCYQSNPLDEDQSIQDSLNQVVGDSRRPLHLASPPQCNAICGYRPATLHRACGRAPSNDAR